MADKRKIKTEASSSSSNINNGRGESVVVDVGRRRSSCGYCKSGSNTSITHGLWAHSLTVHDYQALLDRGWRRSGCFLYKPEMEKTCCPSYTIRLKATDFVPSKEQSRVSKRMQRFLEGSLTVKNQMNKTSHQVMQSAFQMVMIMTHAPNTGISPNDIIAPKASVKPVAPSKRKLQAEEAHDLLYSSNISFQISAALKRGNKTIQKDNQSMDPNPKLIAEILSGHLSNLTPPLHLSVKACNGHINFYSTETQPPDTESITGNGKASSVCKDSSSKGISVNKQSLEIRLKRSGFDPEEYELYRRYQIKVHNDTPDHVTESSYKRFLVDSPLIFVPTSGDVSVPSCGFGSFHQQYLINGKLIAVGVIDILPKCLSSKYLFWDPDLAQLSLGKYSALQEINWVRENEKHCPTLQYYYLGYYIHSCSKMRYKAAYRPSELLCPLRYQWVSFDIAKRLLDRKAYVVLSDYANLLDEGDMSVNDSKKNVVEDQTQREEEEEENERFGEGSNDVRMDGDEEMSEVAFDESDDDDGTGSLTPVEMEKDVSNIVIGLKGMHLKYKDIRQAFGVNERNYLENQLHKYATVVGTDLSERMIYSLG
ncbi:unnamed protein product [Lactuca saligna]|uniref:Arginyl-tRNA--protein transferase n=1 Tax=Lactuca saligna TaxID=75948 RepID=A0AA36DWZ1_LACSI|nr:unnamed protein product [Lactuca saligna]